MTDIILEQKATWSSYIDTLSYILKHPFINIRRTFRDVLSLCVKFSLSFRQNSFCLIIISIILLLLSSVIISLPPSLLIYYMNGPLLVFYSNISTSIFRGISSSVILALLLNIVLLLKSSAKLSVPFLQKHLDAQN